MPYLFVEALGLHELTSRLDFVLGRGLPAMMLDRADELSNALLDVYQRNAPWYDPIGPDRDEHFAESITVRVDASEEGLEVSVETNQPDVREYIAAGHGEIVPVNAQALHWISPAGEDVFTTRVGPVAPNLWEERAFLEAQPILEMESLSFMNEVTAFIGGWR